MIDGTFGVFFLFFSLDMISIMKSSSLIEMRVYACDDEQQTQQQCWQT